MLIGCIRKNRTTKTVRHQAATIDRRRRDRFEETCKSLSEPQKYRQVEKTASKQSTSPDTLKKDESVHTARLTLERNSSRERPNSARPARLGYNKSLIAIQEQALSKIFNETNSEQSRASARQTDRKMMKRDKSLEVGKTQHSIVDIC